MATLIQQASVKVYATADSSIDLDDYIPVFHEWIREKRIADHLLIDVADYRHVPKGPGVMLIADEAHYGIDSAGGEPGLLYSRKRDAPGEARAALQDALQRALSAAALLEQDKRLDGSIRFRTGDLQLRIMSRLAAPNREETRAKIEPIWSEVLGQAGYEGAEFAVEKDPRRPFSLRLRGSSKAPDLVSLLSSW